MSSIAPGGQAASFYVRDGERFVATELTRGPWGEDLQHGGPVAALFASRLQALAPADFLPVRLTVEFLRPVPITALTVATSVARRGRMTHWLDAALSADGKLLARAASVWVQRAPSDLVEAPRPPPFPLPDDSAPFVFPFFAHPVGYHTAGELRLARGPYGQGRAAAWFRLTTAVVAGEPLTPLSRVMAAADSGNGVSQKLAIERWIFLNPDLSVHLFRLPRTDWVALDSETLATPEGIGLARSGLYDEAGELGVALQSLVVRRR